MSLNSKSPLILIRGAGVVGLTCALTLLRAGCRVHVQDIAPGIGPHACSWYAGGMIAPFCERELGEASILTLGQEALPFWSALCPLDILKKNGTLVLAQPRERQDLAQFARRTTGYEPINASKIATLEPLLGMRFPQALYFPSEMHLNPRLVLKHLEMCILREGGEISWNAPDTPLPINPDYTIDCRGWAARDELPDLRGVRGEMLLIRCPGLSLERPVRMLHPRIPLYIVPRGDGVFMVGATMIESHLKQNASVRSVMELLNGLYALHPLCLEGEILEMGADIRPAFPDNMPKIRRRGSVIFVNGLYRHGFLFSPALARRLAAVILENAFFPEVMDENDRE